MRELLILFVHMLTTFLRLARPGGLRSVVAESVLLKHQLLILSRRRRRAPNLYVRDRLIAGFCSLFMSPARLIRSAAVVKPSTLLKLHRVLVKRSVALFVSTPEETWPERTKRRVAPRCRRNEETQSWLGMPSHRRTNCFDLRRTY